MKNPILATLVALLVTQGAQAQTVELAALGALNLEFAGISAVNTYPGQPVAGVASFRSGEAFSVPSPGHVQQIDYLVEPGTPVTKGQPFAVLRGPEMHHLEMNYESSQALATGADQRYKRNKPLYENRSISESQWLEISEKYYATALEYEHMRHFFELVVGGDNDPDALTLSAPLAGVIDYSASRDGVEEGDSIALFIPREAIRLEVALPGRIGADVVAVRVGSCELALQRVSQTSDGMFVQAWTESLPSSCGLMLGQRVLALPLIRAVAAYRVKKSAVFQQEHQSYVWVRHADTLNAVAVTLLGSEGDEYVVSGAGTLLDAEVLVSSVSAVQGVLLGLGDE